MPLTTTQLKISDAEYAQRNHRLQQITGQRGDALHARRLQLLRRHDRQRQSGQGLSSWQQAGRRLSIAGQQWRRAIHRAGAERAGAVESQDEENMARILSLMGILIVLSLANSAIALAQPANYCISVAGKTNLRQSYSTDSPVVEAVPAGTTLHVIYEGTLGNWLKIERNGTETWMARWVRHSRVDCETQSQRQAQQTSEGSSSPSQQEVDNYCLTIWTCTTEDD